jgi:FKBP-type peptidyl-prolyl cis-trans isomerase 2
METPRKAQMGDTVAIHYFCRKQDGTPLESTLAGPPAEIVLGEGMLLDALEQAIVGMAPQQTVSVVLPPEKAFGEYRDELVGEVPRETLPDGLEPQPGLLVEISAEDEDETMQGVISEISEDTVVIDGNHPLAGETLDYQITLVGILS